MTTATRKQRIAILGGGPAGLSAAYHLTNDPDWQDKYEVTVHQLGWRLGGKAASSRNADFGQRIEEHGIHLFGNFYLNMFGMLQDCYATLYPEGVETDEPVTTLDQAFAGSNFQGLPDFIDGKWVFQTGWLAHNDGKPWEGKVPDARTIVDGILYQAYAVVTDSRPPWEPSTHKSHNPITRGLHALEDKALDAAAHVVWAALQRVERDHGVALKAMKGLRSVVQTALHAAALVSDSWHWKFVQLDLMTTLLQGLVADDVFDRDVDFLDQWDYREWLQRHGISDMALASGFAQIVPNIGFNYPGGDSTGYPAFSAAPYVYFFVRQIIAEGDALYYFAAGTGDTIIAPIYRTLVERGVTFEFFNKVTEVVPDGDQIAEIHIDVQAAVSAGADAYQPLTRVKGMYVWPDKPLFAQLDEGVVLEEAGIDLESYWAQLPYEPTKKVLTRGADDGFDFVVMAISIGAIPELCPQILAAHQSWRDMVEHIPAFATQQLQLWFNSTVEELGWDFGLDGSNRVVGANYTYPFNTFCDFTDLMQWEDWGDDGPGSVIYWTGPMQAPAEWPDYDDHDYPAREHARVRATSIQYLRTIRGLLPNANDNPDQPVSLDFNLLHDAQPERAATGENRIDQQYWRANIDPTERYVNSMPGSVHHRKKAWESDYVNMALAGDWTYNGMNIGSIESAATSGAMACLALTGQPTIENIPGLTFMHPDLKGPEHPKINPTTP